MYERVEGESVAPRRGEVGDAHARVLGGGAPSPAQQRLAGRHVRFLTDHDVRYLGKRLFVNLAVENVLKYKVCFN